MTIRKSPTIRPFERAPCFASIFLVTVVLLLFSCTRSETQASKPIDTPPVRKGSFWNERSKEREKMVTGQIEARGVSDPLVLDAMRTVPRHLFVPEPYKALAYADRPLPIGVGQTISQPYIVALMTELLRIDGRERILEVGTGSGYQAAVLAEMGVDLYSIEIKESLAERSGKLLNTMGYGNITLRCGDGYRGWPEHAPFDAIMVTAAPDHIPEPLLAQLKEGGLLVIPVGGFFQELVRITRRGDDYEREKIIPVSFVPMTGEAERK